MGHIPYHDVLYTHPVLPGDRVGHSVCAQHARLARVPPSLCHEEGWRTTGDRGGGPRADSVLYLPFGSVEASYRYPRVRASQTQSKIARVSALLVWDLAGGGVEGSWEAYPSLPPSLHWALHTGGGPSPAQAGRAAS